MKHLIKYNLKNHCKHFIQNTLKYYTLKRYKTLILSLTQLYPKKFSGQVIRDLSQWLVVLRNFKLRSSNYTSYRKGF